MNPHSNSRASLALPGKQRRQSLRGLALGIVLGMLCLGAMPARVAAQTGCAGYPNTLTNGTPADATQVMANFNAIRDCVNQRAGGFRNRIINGNFAINQRGYVTNTVLANGAYAHDRWKAGSASTRYTFSQAVMDTTVTIAAGTLVQVVENVNVEGGSYTLSWSGSAQARVGVNNMAPSGAFAASPLAVSSAAAGQAITVEFNTGTLGVVQLEPSTTATAFERRPLPIELTMCQRYYERISFIANEVIGVGTVTVNFAPPLAQSIVIPWKVTKRAASAVTSSAAGTFAVAGAVASSTSFGANTDRAWGNFYASTGSTGASWTAVPVTATGAAWIEGNSEL